MLRCESNFASPDKRDRHVRTVHEKRTETTQTPRCNPCSNVNSRMRARSTVFWWDRRPKTVFQGMEDIMRKRST